MYLPKSLPSATEYTALTYTATLPEVGDVGGSAHDGKESPLAGHALELVRAAVFELEP
ncbi:MAG: hypothetical protein QOH27_5284 [Mycobacterium sp.]|jgi:hypothetical protein|nr:hypothetical protein [Mycobacterium sp.]